MKSFLRIQALVVFILVPLVALSAGQSLAGSGSQHDGPAPLPSRAGVVSQTPADVRAVFAKKYESAAPLVLDRNMDAFPDKSPDEVRVFEGLAAFNLFVAKERPRLARLADFENVVLPQKETDFLAVVRTHAAQLGGDYVVVVKDPAEIAKCFESDPYLPWVYGIVVYKRAEARLGIEPAPQLWKEKHITCVAGFSPGSKAESSGLRAGDIIKSVDGEALDGVLFWNKALRWKAGDVVTVVIERAGQVLEVQVELSPNQDA